MQVKLERAVKRAMENAGTMPAKEAVKLRPADWKAICDLVLSPDPRPGAGAGDASGVTVTDEIIARVADAIDRAEVGYNLQLTRMVDGESTYTLTYDHAGGEKHEFADIDDGYAHIRQRKLREQAINVIAALSASPAATRGAVVAPFSVYPEQHQKLLDLARLIQRTNTSEEDALKAADTLSDLVRAILEDEALAESGLSDQEQLEQAARCGCRGVDDYCPCQNTPDATTIRNRKGA